MSLFSPHEWPVKRPNFKLGVNLWGIKKWLADNNFLKFKDGLEREGFTSHLEGELLQTSKTEVKCYVGEKWQNFRQVMQIFPDKKFS